MKQFSISLPWHFKRASQFADEVLRGIEQVLQSSEEMSVSRSNTRVIIDWRTLRVFFRASLAPNDAPSYVEYGYYEQAYPELSECVVGRWNINENYQILENLIPNAWGPSLLQKALTDTLAAIAKNPDARLVDGVVVPNKV